VAEYGFVDFNFIGKDRDLLSLHSEPGWQTLNEKLHSQFNKGNSSFLWGIYFGIMFILFFYNLFLFFSLKEISFFYFSVFLFMYASMEILRTPEFNFYLSDVLFWMKYLKPVNSDSFNVCLLTIIYLPFVRSFLSLKKKAQRLDKWMKGLIIGFIAGTVLAYFSDFLKTSIAYPAFILAYSFSVVTGIYLWKIKYQAARFFVVGSFFLLLGLLWNVLFYSQLIHFSGNILVFHPDNIAIIIFLFMSSFALGDKINILKSEKMLAQEKALEILEEKVTERTAEVVKQKEIIEEKNKDITDSINYSKRIQQAKLPKKEEITAALPQNFVLFKPKDIVSGDFYFFHKNNQSVFIAAADCTGHGVPGALMSMIGSEKLDDALSQTTNTSEILSHLNKGIKTSLRQSDSDESTRDGMDIAICSVDTTNCIVNYAGANRPIWIIRKSQQAIEEIKATKKAIGGLTEDNQHFETHEIKLQHGDTFYIFSDGYADTFNGEQGKKLTTKKFKEILL
ncbi:MAG TPA: 7TM diverse intracellular signaling domain-containing protein, partial [Bacteroidia bacterium]|nr:7TM diverse intracellular signaling domain-containing protein [Bacteroidia bacterium]